MAPQVKSAALYGAKPGDGSADKRRPVPPPLQSLQSVPGLHALYSAPGPPSSQSPSFACVHVLVHPAGDEDGGAEPPGEDDGGATPPPLQSKQSVPGLHALYSAPGPPSSQSPSLACVQVLVHPTGEGGGDAMGGGNATGLVDPQRTKPPFVIE